jgi:hypothetical protein
MISLISARAQSIRGTVRLDLPSGIRSRAVASAADRAHAVAVRHGEGRGEARTSTSIDRDACAEKLTGRTFRPVDSAFGVESLRMTFRISACLCSMRACDLMSPSSS